MSALVWAIKSTLIAYVRDMEDGTITLTDGATESAAGFRYPSDTGVAENEDVRRFTGHVRMTGHGGLLRLSFTDPWLTPGESGWMLSFADPDEADIRLDFATVASLDDAGGALIGTGVALTAEGADLFFGPYREGTPLDDLRLEG